jgi:hypothetical protein
VTEERALWLDELAKQEGDAAYLPAFTGLLRWGHNTAGGYLALTPDGWWTELLLCYSMSIEDIPPSIGESRAEMDNSPGGVIRVAVAGRMNSMTGFEWYGDTPGVSGFSVRLATGLLMVVNIAGSEVNVLSQPNAKGKVLFQVSHDKDCLVINKKPIEDSSGQEWYKVIFRYVDAGPDDESGDDFIPPDDPAYIAGKFVEEHPDSDELIKSYGLEFYYTHPDSK